MALHPMPRASKGMTARDQFLAMAFAQITFRESLRDIEACLRGCAHRYAMGIRGNITRTNLAYANEHRDWRVYEALAQIDLTGPIPVDCDVSVMSMRNPGKGWSSLQTTSISQLLRPTEPSEPFHLITFRGDGAVLGMDLDRTNDLLAAEDERHYGGHLE